MQYQARVYAYGLFLLTEKAPGFTLDDPTQPIMVETKRTKLNRAAVFFRFILMMPAAFVTSLVGMGASTLAVVGWILTLVSGRLPTPLFEANAAVLRYQTRMQCYAVMLTAEYPNGLRSDPAPSPGASTDHAGAASPELPSTPRFTRLVLGKGARRVIVLYFAVAVLSFAGFVAVAAAGGFGLDAYNKLDDAHDALALSIDEFQRDNQTCNLTAGGLPCIRQADAKLADAFNRFDVAVAALDLVATDLLQAGQDCETALRTRASATDAASYQAATDTYLEAAQRFDQEYRDLQLFN